MVQSKKTVFGPELIGTDISVTDNKHLSRYYRRVEDFAREGRRCKHKAILLGKSSRNCLTNVAASKPTLIEHQSRVAFGLS